MSRVNFGAKPNLFPMPVLIIGTYDENGVPNAMNAACAVYNLVRIFVYGEGSIFSLTFDQTT